MGLKQQVILSAIALSSLSCASLKQKHVEKRQNEMVSYLLKYQGDSKTSISKTFDNKIGTIVKSNYEVGALEMVRKARTDSVESIWYHFPKNYVWINATDSSTDMLSKTNIKLREYLYNFKKRVYADKLHTHLDKGYEKSWGKYRLEYSPGIVAVPSGIDINSHIDENSLFNRSKMITVIASGEGITRMEYNKRPTSKIIFINNEIKDHEKNYTGLPRDSISSKMKEHPGKIKIKFKQYKR